MSMINKMLRDLDKRHATASGDQAITDNVQLSFLNKPNRTPFYAGGAVVLVAVAGLAWWVGRGSAPAPAATPAAIPAQVAVASVAQPAVSAVTPAAPAVTNNAPTSVAKPVDTVPPAPTSSSSTPAVAPANALVEPPEPTKVAASVAPPAAPPPAPQEAAKPPAPAKATVPVKTPEVIKPAPEIVKSKRTEPEQSVVVPMSTDKTASPMKVVTPRQRAENAYRQALVLVPQGRNADAIRLLREALSADGTNLPARQLLAGLLGESGRVPEAIGMLREGLKSAPDHAGLRLALARLQVSVGAKSDALATLEAGAPEADDGEYHGLLGALLQDRGRHADATAHYIAALQTDPSRATWLIGAGISLRAMNKPADAAEAFQRAIDTGDLSAGVAQFAERQLKQMQGKP